VNTVYDVVAAVLLLSGAVLCLAAGLGLLRFPDVLARMHAGTKPQVLGLLLVLAGAGVRLRTSVDVWMLVLTGLFQLVTVPVSAQLVAKVAHRGRDDDDPPLFVDELRPSAGRRPPAGRPDRR
jgi:multicomponent Na+:H+ antiporter subunit G